FEDASIKSDGTVPSFSLAGNLITVPYYQTNPNDNQSQNWTGVWDVESGEQVARLPYHEAASLSPDGSKIEIGLEIYELSNGIILKELRFDSYELLLRNYERILHY